jgi:PTS system fructose-specific IIA component
MPNNAVPHPHQLLSLDTIRVGLPGKTKDAVINALLDVLTMHPSVKDPEAMRQAVFERERMMSTGVGKGLGLPHAKTTAVKETVAAFAITAEPVDFGAIDDQKVRMLFLLIGTEAAKSEHIKILSRISRLLNRDAFRERLLHAHDARTVLALLEAGELELEAR